MPGTIDVLVRGLGAVALIAALSGCAAPHEVPFAVSAKYYELSNSEYPFSVGIKRCTRGSETVFLVAGLGGYRTTSFYYTADGKPLDSYSHTDVHESDKQMQRPPVDIENYDCVAVLPR